MPKQNFVINRFDGGINTHFNQKDIPDNTLVKVQNAMVDKHGKITVMGVKEDADVEALTGTTYPGYGLFPFQSDYDNPNTTTNIFATNGDFTTSIQEAWHSDSTNYQLSTWLLEDGSGAFLGWISRSLHKGEQVDNYRFANQGYGWHLDASADKLVCNLEFAPLTADDDYYALRTLLMYKSLGSTSEIRGKSYKIVASIKTDVPNSNNKFEFWCHGGVHAETSEGTSDWINPTGTPTEYSAIFQTTEISNSNIGIISYNANAVNFEVDYVRVYQLPSLSDTDYIISQDNNETDIYDKSNRLWSVGEINLDKDNTASASSSSVDTKPIYYIADGIVRVADSNFNNANTISKWYGVINRTNFVDADGNAQFLEWHAGDQKLYKPTGGSHVSSSDNSLRDHYPGRAKGTTSPVQNNAYNVDMFPPLTDTEDDGTSTDGIKFHFGLDTSTDSDNGTWQGTFKFYISYLYDVEKQESGLFRIYDTLTNSDDDRSLVCAFSVKYYNIKYLFNKRVTGARIYYTDSDDSDGIYYQLMDVDFVQGCRKYDDLSYTAWTSVKQGITVECPSNSVKDTEGGQSFFRFLHPPKVLTYQAINGYDADENTIFKYKTAVVANRRCYIGNVGKLDTSDEANNIVEKFNDRIIKSPVNKFDTFPEGNFLDVTINDGDEIIRLETFADRLLQFKRKKLFIINISQDIEFLESEHMHMGVDTHSAVTKTEIGIVWTNKRGCYIYDGKQIKNLIDQKLSQSEWSDFLSESGMIGYIPDKKQIVVLKSPVSTSGDIYIYDLLTTSWTFGNNIFGYGSKTNLTLDSTGEMIFGQYSATADQTVRIDKETTTLGVEAVAPTIELNFGEQPSIIWTGVIPDSDSDSAGFDKGITHWRLFLARKNTGADVTLNNTNALDGNGSTADALTNLIPVGNFEGLNLSVNNFQNQDEARRLNNQIANLNILVGEINTLTSTHFWEAELIGTSITLTYTGTESYWGTGGDGQGTGNSSTKPCDKTPILTYYIGTIPGYFGNPQVVVNTAFKAYPDSDNSWVVETAEDTAVNYQDTSAVAHDGLTYGTHWSLFTIPTHQSFLLWQRSSFGASGAAQVDELTCLGMPGTSGDEGDLTGVSFNISVKEYNHYNYISNEINFLFTKGDDLTDYGGPNTGVLNAFDTNQELANAIRGVLDSLLRTYDLGNVTNTSTPDGIGNGSTNKYKFTMEGKATGERFETLIEVFSGKSIVQFRNRPITNSNGFKIVSKDIDFNQPGIKKNIYKIYVTFKIKDSDDSITQTYCNMYYQIDGTDIESTPLVFSDTKSINYYSAYGFRYDGSVKNISTVTLTDSGGINSSVTDVVLSDTSALTNGDAIKINNEKMLVENTSSNGVEVLRGYQSSVASHSQNDTVYIYPKNKSYVAELVPSSVIKNVNSIQLMLKSNAGTPAKFEIEDITIVYRMKSAK